MEQPITSNGDIAIPNRDVLFSGAESIIYNVPASDAEKLNIKVDYPVVCKERTRRLYRVEALDQTLRAKRIKQESKNLVKALALGVPVPQVAKSDEKDFKLYLELLDGKTLSKLIDEYQDEYITTHVGAPIALPEEEFESDAEVEPSLASSDDTTDVQEKISLWLSEANKDMIRTAFSLAGKYCGLLHSKGICHGDLTPSNIVVKQGINDDINIWLIDFGLSFVSTASNCEDKAVDLYLWERAVRSCCKLPSDLLLATFFGAYESSHPNAKHTINRLEQVRLRGRKRMAFG